MEEGGARILTKICGFEYNVDVEEEGFWDQANAIF
jgi:hypothetical protein